MKKTLSLIMIAMMIASVMLYIAPEELNAEEAQSDIGRAAGDEIKLHDVTSPRESYTDAFSGEVTSCSLISSPAARPISDCASSAFNSSGAM